MAKDAVATMGDLLPDDAGGRDAVHVAVFSAVSEHRLAPGQDIALVSEGETDAIVSAGGNHIGIVDPYLKKLVAPGQRFWVYLYPRSITGLSHRWSHPAFGVAESTYAPPSQKLDAEKWLRDFAESVGLTYSDLMDGAKEYVEYGNYLVRGGLLEGVSVPDSFWENYQIVTGERVAENDRGSFFSCSC